MKPKKPKASDLYVHFANYMTYVGNWQFLLEMPSCTVSHLCHIIISIYINVEARLMGSNHQQICRLSKAQTVYCLLKTIHGDFPSDSVEKHLIKR